jgi:hypothetical protein
VLVPNPGVNPPRRSLTRPLGAARIQRPGRRACQKDNKIRLERRRDVPQTPSQGAEENNLTYLRSASDVPIATRRATTCRTNHAAGLGQSEMVQSFEEIWVCRALRRLRRRFPPCVCARRHSVRVPLRPGDTLEVRVAPGQRWNFSRIGPSIIPPKAPIKLFVESSTALSIESNTRWTGTSGWSAKASLVHGKSTPCS